ncbi:hypothetical protein IFR05_006971 [Cadophora sp. M221]|nr:hypothetical protein IFR05_006971 [Cadophora sp. M221]
MVMAKRGAMTPSQQNDTVPVLIKCYEDLQDREETTPLKGLGLVIRRPEHINPSVPAEDRKDYSTGEEALANRHKQKHQVTSGG